MSIRIQSIKIGPIEKEQKETSGNLKPFRYATTGERNISQDSSSSMIEPIDLYQVSLMPVALKENKKILVASETRLLYREFPECIT